MSSLKKMLRDTDDDVIIVVANDDGGFKLEVKNEASKTEWCGNYYGLVAYDELRNLEGKILTIVDASFTDKEQRKAVKDIVRRTFWFDWVEHHIYKGKTSSCGSSVGMPSEDLSLQ
jgi:hypothetical protein